MTPHQQRVLTLAQSQITSQDRLIAEFKRYEREAADFIGRLAARECIRDAEQRRREALLVLESVHE